MNGLTPTVILLFFLATAPVGLLPTVLAFVTKQRHRAWVTTGNIILWGLLYVGARAFTLDGSSAFTIPTYLALLAWLFLFGWSLRNLGGRAAA